MYKRLGIKIHPSLFYWIIQYNTIQYKILLATKHSAMLMANKVYNDNTIVQSRDMAQETSNVYYLPLIKYTFQ